jgi:exonuclease VII large subunit
MSSIRNALVSVLIASAVAGGTACTPTPSAAAESIIQSAKSAAGDVSKWTQKQWNAAKAKWAKEKDKWAACNSRATDQKLSGRKSWSFLYDCMTS